VSEPRIAVFPADAWGCGTYRLRNPALALQKLGHNILVMDDATIINDANVTEGRDGLPVIKSGSPPDVDIIVMQRPSSALLVAAIRFLRAAGVRVVIDLDDHFDAIRPDNSAWAAYQTIDVNPRQIHLAVAEADVVTLSTPGLVDIYGGVAPTTVLLENCVPEWYLDLPDTRTETLGWCGSIATHKGDLAVTRGAVGQALTRAGWDFRVVGEGAGVAKELGLAPEQVRETGWLPLHNYIIEMSRLGVAITPLANHAFNVEGKSFLKPLEAASLGVPVVYSDVREYRRLGVGLAASNARQWKAALLKLMTDSDFRDEVGVQGREIASKWTYEARAHLWLDAWTS
jgi:hypothetical protein